MEAVHSAEEKVGDILDLLVEYIVARGYYDELEGYKTANQFRLKLCSQSPCFFMEKWPNTGRPMKEFEHRDLKQFSKEDIVKGRGWGEFAGVSLDVVVENWY